MQASRTIAFTAALSALTVLFSLFTVPFLFGFRIHFFQVGIFLAGVVGGPVSGIVTGLVGGVYMATMRSDPTIVVGNGLLGLFTGIFSLRLRPAFAGLIAWFFIQAPWVYLTSTFIFHVPAVAMQLILMLLTVEDVISAVVADVLSNHLRLREYVGLMK